MYHFDPEIALDELTEENLLPNPVYLRDMLLRAKLSPPGALELNRMLQEYLRSFGESQRIAKEILAQLGGDL